MGENVYGNDRKFKEISKEIIGIAKSFYMRGWLFGTSGNLSAKLQESPIRLAITASSVNKGKLEPSHVIEIGEDLKPVNGSYRPSSEAAIHIEIVKSTGAGAVFHTHSPWTTVLSEKYLPSGGINIGGYEMLKGLDGVHTHNHVEWMPILENSQDMLGLSRKVSGLLHDMEGIHCIMLSGHGLYTWGKTLDDAERHVEIIEFLMEARGRSELLRMIQQ